MNPQNLQIEGKGIVQSWYCVQSIERQTMFPRGSTPSWTYIGGKGDITTKIFTPRLNEIRKIQQRKNRVRELQIGANLQELHIGGSL
jgi:hypothetical protein